MFPCSGKFLFHFLPFSFAVMVEIHQIEYGRKIIKDSIKNSHKPTLVRIGDGTSVLLFRLM
jgi:hypothetical protein